VADQGDLAGRVANTLDADTVIAVVYPPVTWEVITSSPIAAPPEASSSSGHERRDDPATSYPIDSGGCL